MFTPSIDAATIQGYRETDYRVGGEQPFTLRIGQTCCRGTIDFVRAVIDQPIPLAKLVFPGKVMTLEARSGINTFGATRGLLALAPNGASEDHDGLVHERPAVSTIRRGSL